MTEPNVIEEKEEEEATTTIEASVTLEVGATETPPAEPTTASDTSPGTIPAAVPLNQLQPPEVWTNLVVPEVPVSEWQDDPIMHEVGQYIRISIVNDVDGLISAMATELGWTSEEITVYAAHIRREMCGLKIHAYYHGGNAYAQKPLNA
ncbi:hypothetical protein CMQ_1692 [Grosmannia clavigera kw1407]|uniref:Uncharacterized protein n=1 Tax=Grosmannia clavigera (strain kw1407 / UAMH 11150) TaxID=655863 RepID=F0XF69_GROCL|nr:uncharacterized protein CMQ_1692 [Grosmannia clavigera kw1407]EFX04764.1 hypothetical protein CMQ_1692 [Grosmannia clavigera kw1407]